MAAIKMRELLEAGVHFGHQAKRWNPKMKPYIFGERNNIYIVDLQKTVRKFEEAYRFIVETVSHGGRVLFVSTKRQAQATIEKESNRVGMPFVTHRWLGGMLTNFRTIRKSIEKWEGFEDAKASGEWQTLPKKEAIRLDKARKKLERNLLGIRTMTRLPSALFVVDPKKEAIAVHEANKLGIPVVAIVDTNCDPDMIDYVIPGNDDAIRAIRLLTSRIADAVQEGSMMRKEALQEDVKPVSRVAVPAVSRAPSPKAPPEALSSAVPVAKAASAQLEAVSQAEKVAPEANPTQEPPKEEAAPVVEEPPKEEEPSNTEAPQAEAPQPA